MQATSIDAKRALRRGLTGVHECACERGRTGRFTNINARTRKSVTQAVAARLQTALSVQALRPCAHPFFIASTPCENFTRNTDMLVHDKWLQRLTQVLCKHRLHAIVHTETCATARWQARTSVRRLVTTVGWIGIYPRTSASDKKAGAADIARRIRPYLPLSCPLFRSIIGMEPEPTTCGSTPFQCCKP